MGSRQRRIKKEARLKAGKDGSLKEGGIELLIQGHHEDGSIEHPSVFLCWCFNPELYDRIQRIVKKKETAVARVLVLVRYNNERYSEKRYLFDPTIGKGFIDFSRDGAHAVFATVVYGESEEELYSKFFSRDLGSYNTDVLSYGGGEFVLPRGFAGAGKAIVNVPEGVFAKRPPDWKWLTWMWKPRDQCHVRWLRVPAYTIQPIIWVVYQVCAILVAALFMGLRGLLALLLLSVGIRGLSFEPIINLKYQDTDDIWNEARGSLFIPKKGRFIFPVFFALSPLCIVLPFIMDYIAQSFRSGSWMSWTPDLTTVLILWLLVFSGLAVVNLLTALVELYGHDDRKLLQVMEREQEMLRQQREFLVCSAAMKMEPSIKGTPLRLKTINLYFRAVKQGVCRSFAG